MASAAIFSSLRRRRSPSPEAFLAPVNLSSVALLQTLTSVSTDLVSSFSGKSLLFQTKNTRSLIRKVKVLVLLLDCLKESTSSRRQLPQKAVLCLKELYLLLYRSKIVLDYCSLSSKLWLLLQNPSISGHFNDLSQEISSILDVFPIGEVGLSQDVKEQVELMHRQCRRAQLYVDERDEGLRIRFFELLDEFQNGRVPDGIELKSLFVEKLKICDAKSCRTEIEFLEGQIVNHEGDLEPSASVLNGFVALARYCRFLLFGFEEDEFRIQNADPRKSRRTGDIPKDFCCPISLDLMQDPVVIATGQTYDRCSISRWIEEGHCTCPKTGQMLAHTRLVQNRSMRNLIARWCNAYGIEYNHNSPLESELGFAPTLPSLAALEANRATTKILIRELEIGLEPAKAIAAREIRLLSKTWKENGAMIGESGAIPLLHALLSSPNPTVQENSVTAMLNLSIHDKNKRLIMDLRGCLPSIVEVLISGHTRDSRENAAAALFSLSAIHEHKKRIAEEEGAVEALTWLLSHGTARGRRDAVAAIFNLATRADNAGRLVLAGAVTALVGALGDDVAAEEAAVAVGLLARAAAVAGEGGAAVEGLAGMIRRGTARGKEKAVAALVELCRSGAAEAVVAAPALGGLVQGLMFTGTKRARRKAASLVRVFQRCQGETVRFGRDVTVAVPVSVPVL